MIRILLAEDQAMVRGALSALLNLEADLDVVGTAADVADLMEDWFAARGCDGFNIMASHLPAPAYEAFEWLVPELQRRGMFRTEYASRTLRGNLGVPVPASRYGGAVLPER